MNNRERRIGKLRRIPVYGNIGTYPDEFIAEAMDDALSAFLEHTRRTVDPGEMVDSIIIELCKGRINKTGVEGQSSTGEGGVTQSWEIEPWLKTRMSRYVLLYGGEGPGSSSGGGPGGGSCECGDVRWIDITGDPSGSEPLVQLIRGMTGPGAADTEWTDIKGDPSESAPLVRLIDGTVMNAPVKAHAHKWEDIGGDPERSEPLVSLIRGLIETDSLSSVSWTDILGEPSGSLPLVELIDLKIEGIPAHEVSWEEIKGDPSGSEPLVDLIGLKIKEIPPHDVLWDDIQGRPEDSEPLVDLIDGKIAGIPAHDVLWEDIQGRPEDSKALADALDEKLDKSGYPNMIYGTDANGEQIMVDLADQLNAKLDKNSTPDKVYGTDSSGHQVMKDLPDTGGLQSVSNLEQDLAGGMTKYPSSPAVAAALNDKVDKTGIVHELGGSEEYVISQKKITELLHALGISKVGIDQGTENAGKALVIGPDGLVIPRGSDPASFRELTGHPSDNPELDGALKGKADAADLNGKADKTDLNAYIPLSQKGASGGVVDIDSSNRINLNKALNFGSALSSLYDLNARGGVLAHVSNSGDNRAFTDLATNTTNLIFRYKGSNTNGEAIDIAISTSTGRMAWRTNTNLVVFGPWTEYNLKGGASFSQITGLPTDNVELNNILTALQSLKLDKVTTPGEPGTKRAYAVDDAGAQEMHELPPISQKEAVNGFGVYYKVVFDDPQELEGLPSAFPHDPDTLWEVCSAEDIYYIELNHSCKITKAVSCTFSDYTIAVVELTNGTCQYTGNPLGGHWIMPMFANINAQIVPVHRPYWKDERLALAKETTKYFDAMPTNADGKLGDVIIVKNAGIYQKRPSKIQFFPSIEDADKVLSQNQSNLNNAMNGIIKWGWKLENGIYKTKELMNPLLGPDGHEQWTTDSISSSIVKHVIIMPGPIGPPDTITTTSYDISGAKVVLHGEEWVPLMVVVPDPPSSGTHTLKSVGGVMQWV